MKKEQFISICEDKGWDVTEDGEELMIHQFSNAGEDFFFYVSNECDPMEVFCYAEDFDAEDHCAMWLEAKRNGANGVPGLFELVEDAKDIQKMLDELADALIAASNQERTKKLLWDILKKHAGHRVEIAVYGDPENPANISLEDMDTNEVILDAELYTICPVTDD